MALFLTFEEILSLFGSLEKGLNFSLLNVFTGKSKDYIYKAWTFSSETKLCDLFLLSHKPEVILKSFTMETVS